MVVFHCCPIVVSERPLLIKLWKKVSAHLNFIISLLVPILSSSILREEVDQFHIKHKKVFNVKVPRTKKIVFSWKLYWWWLRQESILLFLIHRVFKLNWSVINYWYPLITIQFCYGLTETQVDRSLMSLRSTSFD